MPDPRPLSPGRDSTRELEERRAFLAIALNDGLSRRAGMRLAMETFQVSRRMAPIHVQRVQTRTGTLEFVLRICTRMLRERSAPGGAQGAQVAPHCAGATGGSP